MTAPSLFDSGTYSTHWVHGFYTQAGSWWGPDPHDDPAEHTARAKIVERLCGPSSLRILDLGAGSGRTAAALADRGHTVIGVELNPTDVGYAQSLLPIKRPGK